MKLKLNIEELNEDFFSGTHLLGIMVNAKNAESLSEAMIQLMSKDSKTLAEMGNNASRFIKANFNIDTIIKKWIEILN